MRNYLSIKTLLSYKMKISHEDWITYRNFVASKGGDLDILDSYISWTFIPWDSYGHPRHEVQGVPSLGNLTMTPKLEALLIKDYLKFRNGQGATWITLSPDHLKRKMVYSKENIEKLKGWCTRFFDDKRYSFYHWCIESGENEDDPHLHVHALLQFNKGFSQNHSRDLRAYWNKTFPESKLIGKDYYSVNMVGIYLQDKLDYMNKGIDGSNHGNFINLNLHKSEGELN